MTSRAVTYRPSTRLERLAHAIPRTGPLGALRHGLRGAYTRLLGGRSGMLQATLPGGESINIDPAWRHISWNPDEYAAFRAAVRPGDIVLDAGANVGCYAVLFGQWVGHTGRVFAFEPDPRAFAGLVRHIAINGLSGRVVPVQAALSDSTGRLAFELADASGVSRLCLATSGTAFDVPATTVDDFCASENVSPSVLKIDVEGAELAVLRGARRMLRRADVELFMELHPAIWPTLGLDAATLQAELAASGFDVDAAAGADPWTTEGVCLRFRRRR